MGEEVKRPDRNLPLSLMLGTTVVMCLYMLLNVVYLYALPLSAMAGVINVGQTAAQRLLQPGVAGFITLAIVLAMGASMNATILSGARLSYAMARDGLLWSALSAVHHKYGVPHVALLCQALLAGIFVLVETFENLLGSVVLVMLLSCIGSGLAHIVLRYRMPAAARPYKTLGYPFVPLLFVGGYVWIAVQIVMSNPASSLVGLLVTLSGLPLYLWVFRRRKSLDPAL
ncbi:MAG TPA: hypothetical protein DCR97_12890 [Deltaproteobacteria bacterium]|nr:hypothetical protein [Deltaproteobacteria bacterium]